MVLSVFDTEAIFFGENVQYGLPGFEIHVKRLIDRNSLSTVILK